MEDQNFIFLISQPRSGSTLLQAILSNNPQVATVSEPWLLLPFSHFHASKDIRTPYNFSWASIAFRDYFEKYIPQPRLNQLLKDTLNQLYQPAFRDGATYFLDKTPRYYLILPFIRALYPKARIIILKRDPLLVLHSIIKTWKIETLKRMINYKVDLLDAPRLIHQFLQNNQDDALTYVISYEDLMAEPEKNIRAIYQWLEIPYEASVLDYEKNDKYQGIYGDPVKVKQVGRLSPDHKVQAVQFEQLRPLWKAFYQAYLHHLGKDFLKEYGYEPDIPGRPHAFYEYFLSLENRIELDQLSLKFMLKHWYYKLRFGGQHRKI